MKSGKEETYSEDPIGYGLSYTSFSNSNIRADKASVMKGDTITISVDIKNS
jgi:hypothetical protein